MNNWADQGATATPVWGGSVSLTAGSAVPITVEYYDHGGAASVSLWVKDSGGTSYPVPASWLTPDAPALPTGWGISADLDGALAYASMRFVNQDAVMVASDGSTHTWPWNGSTWTAPVGESGSLTKTPDGLYAFQATDTMTYRFNADGTLNEVKSSTDDLHPAAAQYSWGGSPPRLTSVTDPVSGRAATLAYGGGSCPTSPPSGFTVAPQGMLCQVNYWDGTNTTLWYASGQLARLVDPGGQTTDLGYDGNGRLSQVRDPLGFDAVAVGTRTNDNTTRTVVAYDASTKVTAVTLPKAQAADTTQPGHTYTYPSASETRVNVAGLSPASGFARKVTYDVGAHALTDTDATNHTTTTTWNTPADAPASVIDPAGFETTTLYDAANRPTDTYGPAPSTSFNASTLLPTVGGVAHATTEYDGGVPGLAAAYFNSSDLSGATVGHDTGVGPSDGTIQRTWGSTAPVGGVTIAGWSAAYSGQVTMPNQSGNYTFESVTQGGVRLYVDDTLILSNWTPGYTGSTIVDAYHLVNVSANSVHRIRVEYTAQTSGASSNAKLELWWRLPDGTTHQVIPGAELAPRYGLVTKTTDADGNVTQNLYQQTSDTVGPALGLVTSTIVDPGASPHLNLTSTNTYESTLYRRTQHTLPKGSGTAVTDAYYGNTETASPPTDCGGGSAVNQGGRAKITTDATPASGHGSSSAVTHQVVYDSAGRVIASKEPGDAHWFCTVYDSRGRVASTTDSSAAQRTTTYDYHDGTTPGTTSVTAFDSTGASHTTTTVVDLLGRTISYTDERGTVTRTVYDQAGRATDVYRTLPGDSERHELSTVYDDSSRVTSQTEYLTNLTTGSTTNFYYDTAGRPTTTSRPTTPNPLIDSTSYDTNTGRVSSLTHTVNGSTLWSDTLGYTTAGKINHDAATNVTRDYTFDAAGRLTQTNENTAPVRAYSYDADTNRCALTVSTPVACTGDGTPVAKDVSLPGTSSVYLDTPDSAGNSVTGDLDIRVKANLADWTPAGWAGLMSKSASPSTNYAYGLEISSTGKPVLTWGTSSSTGAEADATGGGAGE